MTVQELLMRISSLELAEWAAYYEIEPFGQERDNLHAGIVAATVANVNRGKGKKPVQAGDFMLRVHADEPPDPAEVMRKFRAYLSEAD